MDLTEAHDLLFTRCLDASSRLYELEQYLEYTQAYLHRERDYFRDEAHPDLEIEFLPLFKDTFPPILNASVIVATAMLLEQEVRELAAALAMAFNLKVKLNDLTGSVLERFRTLATKIVDLTIEGAHFQWTDLVGLFELRNCIVHSQGQLSDFQRAPTVVAFASKYHRQSRGLLGRAADGIGGARVGRWAAEGWSWELAQRPILVRNDRKLSDAAP